MSRDKKNIDFIYKENLEKLSVSPPDHLWHKIEAQLPQKKKNSHKLFLWLPVGIAASFLLFFGFQLTRTPKIDQIFITNTTVEMEEICPEDKLIEKTQNASYTNETERKIDVLTTNPKKRVTIQSKSVIQKKSAYAQNSLLKIEEKKDHNKTLRPNTTINNNAFAGNGSNKNLKINETPESSKLISDKKNHPVVIEKRKETIEKITTESINTEEIKKQLAELENSKNKEIKEKSKSKKNWSIQPQIAPLVYNSLSGGSPIADNFADNGQSLNADISYGIKIAYQFSDKLTIRTGISNASVNVTTNQVGISGFSSQRDSNSTEASVLGLSITDLSTADSFQNSNQVSLSSDSLTDKNNNSVSLVSGSLRQNFNYLEIPVELTYHLIDKKIGLQLIGGMSTLILNGKQNEAIFKTETSETNIGRASENTNSTSFSGNFGVGLDYEIAPNFRISIEPVMKVQFNAFNNTNFNPYIFGIYSGINFRL